MNIPDDNRPSWRTRESNIGLWVLGALGALVLLGILSWSTSDTIDNAQSTAPPPIADQADRPATIGESTGETGKGQ